MKQRSNLNGGHIFEKELISCFKDVLIQRCCEEYLFYFRKIINLNNSESEQKKYIEL
jgi:hypothetical protein